MATHNDNIHVHLPVFEGKNFDQWSVKIKLIFRFQDVLEIVNEGVTALAANATDVQQTAHRELKQKDGKAMFLMHQSVSNEIFDKIMHYESAKEIFIKDHAYLINRSPTKKLHDKTPEEAWCGVKPSVQHLKILSSLCYKHVPDQLRKKLDDKS